MGAPNMPREKVIAAALAALAHDFIMEMPRGYETIMQRQGPAELSGGAAPAAGHCARVAEGRADSNDQDPSNSTPIGNAGTKRAQQPDDWALAVFVIAHRLSTVRRADVIAVLDNGTDSRVRPRLSNFLYTTAPTQDYDIQFRDVEPLTRAAGPV